MYINTKILTYIEIKNNQVTFKLELNRQHYRKKNITIQKIVKKSKTILNKYMKF